MVTTVITVIEHLLSTWLQQW